MKQLGNAALSWQSFVITLSTRRMFLHKFTQQERVKKGNCWKNLLSLNTTENNSITLRFFLFSRLEEGTQISITNPGLQGGSWNLERWCFQRLEVSPFWLLDCACTFFQECLCLESTSRW